MQPHYLIDRTISLSGFPLWDNSVALLGVITDAALMRDLIECPGVNSVFELHKLDYVYMCGTKFVSNVSLYVCVLQILTAAVGYIRDMCASNLILCMYNDTADGLINS